MKAWFESAEEPAGVRESTCERHTKADARCARRWRVEGCRWSLQLHSPGHTRAGVVQYTTQLESTRAIIAA